MSADGCPTPEVSLPDATAPLPDDPAVLQQMIRELLDVLRQTRHENEQLQHRLDLLLRRLYGPRTERFDPNQPLLIPDAFDTPEVPTASDATSAPVSAEPAPATAAEPRKKQRGHGRKGLPENLPRVPVRHELHFIDVADEQCKAQLRQRSAALPAGSPWTSEAAFDAITAYFQPPATEEGFNVILHRPA